MNNGPKDIQILIPRTYECYLYDKGDFADVIKHLEMGRLSLWCYKCLYTEETEGDLTTKTEKEKVF